MDNRLYRSRETKMLAGVCGGIADMYNFDPTLVRLIAVALIFFSGFTFFLIYLVCAIVIPMEPSPGYILRRHRRTEDPYATTGQGQAAPAENGSAVPKEEPPMAQDAPAEPYEAVVKETPSEKPYSEAGTTGKAEAEAGHADQSFNNDDTVINTQADRY